MIKIPVGNTYSLIDEEDLQLASSYKWYLTSHGYAANKSKKQIVYLHRLLMKAPNGLQVDHKNMDRLDNRKNNLRLCTIGQNRQNEKKRKIKSSSKYKGVYFCKNRNKPWCVQIRKEGIKITIGYFKTEKEAAEAYDKHAKLFYNEFARLNLG